MAVATTDAPSEVELEQASGEGNCCDDHDVYHRLPALHECSTGNSDGERKGYCPEVEGKVASAENVSVEARHGVSHQPSEKQGQNEDGEHFPEDSEESGEKGQSLVRMGERKEQGSKECYGHVDENGVGGCGGCITAQFLCHYSASCGGGADENQQETFHGIACCQMREKPQEKAAESEDGGLDEEQPQVPYPRSQFRRLHLAESHEKHAEEKARLYEVDAFENPVPGVPGKGKSGSREIGQDARQDGDGERPILYEPKNPHVCLAGHGGSAGKGR